MSNYKQELQDLELRQLAVKQIMADSDNHAAQAIKLGVNFAENYPQEYADYNSARTEYHANAERIEELKILIAEEEQETRPIEDIKQ